MRRLVLAMAGFWLCALGHASAQDRPSAADASFKDAQLMASARVSAALAEGAARIAAPSPELTRLVDADRAAVQTRRALETELAVARAQSGEAAAQRARGIAADLALATGQAEQARGRLLESFPAYASLTDPTPLSIAEVQTLLGADEALVLMQPVEGAIFIWAITPHARTWHRVEAGRAATDVEALLSLLRRAGGRGAEDASRRSNRPMAPDDGLAEGRRLYDLLWQPVADTLGTAKTVYVVAEGYLSVLPPALLVGDERSEAPAYLIRRHALVTLPGVNSLRAARLSPVARSKGGRGALFRGFGLVRQETSLAKGLPDLPGVERELYAIARTVGAPRRAVTLEATEAAIKASNLDGVSLIHLAAHGLPAGSEGGPIEAALVFGAQGTEDGYLTASEAGQLKLSADLVILSACDTGATGDPGPAYGGLLRAFFYAGARALVVSNWAIDDEAAEHLTTRLVREMRSGHPAAEAMRRAQLSLLDNQRHHLSHPSHWAALSLIGDGQARLAR